MRRSQLSADLLGGLARRPILVQLRSVTASCAAGSSASTLDAAVGCAAPAIDIS
jgi:hypothetical protein